MPKKPTYKQDWPRYNLAQTTEKRRFRELLFDLCRDLQQPPQPKTGRRPHRVQDAVFAMAYKVYSGFSSRRFDTDLQDAHQAGLDLARMPKASHELMLARRGSGAPPHGAVHVQLPGRGQIPARIDLR